MAAVAVVALLAACDDPVPPPVPTTVTVSPSAAELAAVGETVKLAATVRDQNGNTMTDVAATWSSRQGAPPPVGVDTTVAGQAPARSLLLWGGTGADGRPDLHPVFIVDAPPALPASGGDHQLRGLDAAGGELFSLRFDMPEIADADGQSAFAFALPADPRWADALASVTLSGPGGAVTLDSNTDQPMTILQDMRTGQIRAILRNRARAQAVAATLNADILFSRGIPAPDAWRR